MSLVAQTELSTMRKVIPILPLALLLQACGTTNPGDAAGITYRLPRTDAKVTLSIDVLDCHYKDPKAADPKKTPDLGLQLKASLKVDAVAGARDEAFHVNGADLNSSTIKRSLTIGVDDNGVISNINSTSTDQRAVIFGNVAKIGVTLVGTLAAPAGAESTPVIICNKNTENALANLKAAESAMNSAKLNATSSANRNSTITDTQKKINALAQLIAGYKATLHRDVPGEIEIDELTSDDKKVEVEFDKSVLSELFDTAYVGRGHKNPDEGITKESVKLFNASASLESDTSPSNAVNIEKESSLKKCEQAIVLPNARTRTLVVETTGSLFEKKKLHKSLPVSQLNPNSSLCLSTTFGENRTISLKMDKFGRVTELIWVSDAQLANITSAIAGTAPDVGTTYEGVRDLGVARDKLELTRLQTEQSLRKARQCQAILDAGGTQCP